jgi:cell wall-associated NlpC family hydrolase
MSRAPNELDCSSLTKWAYAQKGVWLPRLSVQQCQIGEQVDERQMRAGDLVFTEGLRSNFIVPETRMTVGHVGITTSEDTVLHAAYKERTVTETPYKLFAKKGLRTIRRIIPEHSTYTVIVPQGYEIETSDDLRWLILRKLK